MRGPAAASVIVHIVESVERCVAELTHKETCTVVFIGVGVSETWKSETREEEIEAETMGAKYHVVKIKKASIILMFRNQKA